MTKLREAAQQALDVLFRASSYYDTYAEIEALRAALEQPEQEPVAWECKAGGLKPLTQAQYDNQTDNIKRHYSRIPHREWQGLTDEEIDKVTDSQWSRNNHKPIYAAHRAYARAIERAHGIGEKG